MEKLKKRWGIQSNLQLAIIFLVFTINGSFAVYVAKPITAFFGLEAGITHPMLFWPARILLVFAVYQVTLVMVGTLFGQRKFFWNMEKKMLQRMGFGRLLQ